MYHFLKIPQSFLKQSVLPTFFPQSHHCFLNVHKKSYQRLEAFQILNFQNSILDTHGINIRHDPFIDWQAIGLRCLQVSITPYESPNVFLDFCKFCLLSARFSQLYPSFGPRSQFTHLSADWVRPICLTHYRHLLKCLDHKRIGAMEQLLGNICGPYMETFIII